MLLFRVKVEGESLWPELIPGRVYWASKLVQPRVGQYVVFKNPADASGYFVKKVLKVDNDILGVGGTISRSSKHMLKKQEIMGTLLGGIL